MAADTSIKTLTLYSNEATTVNELEFSVGSTAYIEGNITPLGGNATASVVIGVYKSINGTLIENVLTTTYYFTTGTAYSIRDDINSGTSITIDTTSYDPGKYHLKLSISGSGVRSTFLYVGFEIVAAVTTPSISTATISTASITEAGSVLVSSTVTNMTANDNVFLTYDSKAYLMDTTDNSAYTKTIYGFNHGVTSSSTIEILAENSGGRASDTSLSLAITTGTVEAVSFIDALLDANWDSGNVTKPTIISGGEARSHHRASSGDLVKVYRSPIPTKRTPKFKRSYEYRDEFVQVMITTTNASPRVRLEALKTEIIRIINASGTAPGSGWDKMWVDTVEVRKEFSQEFKAVLEITLTKILTAVRT